MRKCHHQCWQNFLYTHNIYTYAQSVGCRLKIYSTAYMKTHLNVAFTWKYLIFARQTPNTPSSNTDSIDAFDVSFPPRNNILATRLWIFVSLRARVKYLLMLYRMGLTTYPFLSRTVVMIWVSRLKARDSVTRRWSYEIFYTMTQCAPNNNRLKGGVSRKMLFRTSCTTVALYQFSQNTVPTILSANSWS